MLPSRSPGSCLHGYRTGSDRPRRRRSTDRRHGSRAASGHGPRRDGVRRRGTRGGTPGPRAPPARPAAPERSETRRTTTFPNAALRPRRQRAVPRLVPSLEAVEAARRTCTVSPDVVFRKAVEALTHHQKCRHRTGRGRGTTPAAATLHCPKTLSIRDDRHARRVHDDGGQTRCRSQPWRPEVAARLGTFARRTTTPPTLCPRARGTPVRTKGGGVLRSGQGGLRVGEADFPPRSSRENQRKARRRGRGSSPEAQGRREQQRPAAAAEKPRQRRRSPNLRPRRPRRSGGVPWGSGRRCLGGSRREGVSGRRCRGGSRRGASRRRTGARWAAGPGWPPARGVAAALSSPLAYMMYK